MTKKAQQNQHAIPNSNIFTDSLNFVNNHIGYLNNSKFFAGCVMILLNVGSKFISIQFSKSTEEYLKMSISKQILVFAMAWMGTRDIYAALGLTAVFVILSDHLFNEESAYCVLPQKYREYHLFDTNKDGIVSQQEITDAENLLAKAKQQHTTQNKEAVHKFFLDNKYG
jgi:hypothetical protein